MHVANDDYADQVAEAAVVGIHDELTGQAVNAFVALKDGAERSGQEGLGDASAQVDWAVCRTKGDFCSAGPAQDTIGQDYASHYAQDLGWRGGPVGGHHNGKSRHAANQFCMVMTRTRIVVESELIMWDSSRIRR